VLGADHVTAHDAADGRELWRVGGLNPEGNRLFRSIASPVAVGDLIVAPYARGSTLTAIRRGGKGDVTDSHVAWVRKDLGADVPTPAARPTEDRVRSDGMVSAAAVPVRNDQGQMLAILYGGDLLNRRDALVDSIKQQVYHGVVYRGKDIGTVTIFQGDLRIATNVMMGKDRAVGTRLSAPVCEEVLDRGGTWAAPAFVVNDWYITAYEPIRDPAGRIIGALYVGILQAPYIQQRNVISGVFLGAVLVASLASLTLVFLANHLVLRPIRHVLRMAQRVIAGDLTARVGIRPPGEMGALCQAIDAMAQAVAQREELLQQATRRQIGRSEQLASVGRLAAGVAHEINNPLTGVLAFADLLRQKENMDEQDRQDLEVIVREAIRAREIVRGLLDYARETPSAQVPLNANEAVVQVVKLLGKREAFQHIVIVEDLAEDLPLVNADRNQLEQVLVNLSLNACEAMPNGGTLMLATSSAHGKVVVEVTDTGCGISKEHLDRIFEPFFTTKPVGKGTGLGLSVSYGIVRQHGGALEVESQEGKGSTFKIILPALRGARGVGPSASLWTISAWKLAHSRAACAMRPARSAEPRRATGSVTMYGSATSTAYLCRRASRLSAVLCRTLGRNRSSDEPSAYRASSRAVTARSPP